MHTLTKLLHVTGFILFRRFVKKSLISRFSILVKISKFFLPEYRFTEPLLSWQNDQLFNRYLEKFSGPHLYNDYRRFSVKELLKLSLHVDGDTAEVGCFAGATSYLILAQNTAFNAHRSEGLQLKRHFIFDSFQGLSKPHVLDGDHWQSGRFAIDEPTLRLNLHDFSGSFEVYVGWVPARFSEVEDRRFSFVHIDVDLYEPTLASLEFFYDKMSVGGILVIDDYGFENNPGVNIASKNFLSGRPEQLITLPTGGAFFIKR
jgi:hypothetical protein